MQPFGVITGIAAPLYRSNISTDDIYPGSSSPVWEDRMMYESDPEILAPNAFGVLRWLDDKSPNPAFILNSPPYDRASFLIAGDNFGCGSSRETAAWALRGIGIRAVLAPSFGMIFAGNCAQNGMLAIAMPHEDIRMILKADPVITVDLAGQLVRTSLGAYPFQIDPRQKHMVENGLDEILLTQSHSAEIDRFEQRYRERRNWLSDGPS